MKRAVAILLACMMVFGVSATVFAADSPSGESTDEIQVGLSDVSVSTDGVTVSAIAEDDENHDAVAALYAAPLATLADIVGSEDEDGNDVDDYSLAYLIDISGDVSDGSVVLSLPDITADSVVIVLHYVNGVWQQEDAVAGDGTLTIYADSFSPFAIYILEDEDSDSEDEDTDTEDEDEDVSDTTGESNMILLIAVVAVLAAAGLAVSSKKVRE